MFFANHTLGKYKIVSALGSGGFGTVYLAEDTWLNKKVALKVPHRQNLNFSELLREPRLLASLNHPNIVAITTAEKQDDVFFIVMEYVPGETLETIIATGGRLDVDRALGYATQIARAVEHAHSQGIIHRDLRPANVLVSEADVLKVADFGTSRFLEIAAHGTTIIGSPPYMAPEQFRGEAVFASDIYSLGITAYQMLTGLLPYDTPAPGDMGRLLRGELVRPPRQHNAAIPGEVNDVVMKALAPVVTDRYQRAGELLADLQAVRTARRATPAHSAVAEPAPSSGTSEGAEHGLRARLRSRPTPAGGFCWHCRKPLHARADRCPFCNEAQ